MSAPHPFDPDATGRVARRPLLVSTVVSDSHTWNLVFLQLFLEEVGFDVVNLGACVPDDVIVEECRKLRPPVLVLSSVNGHGHIDALRLIRRLRAEDDLRELRVVIGGKLGSSGADETVVAALLQAGFDAVFAGEASPDDLRAYLDRVGSGAPVMLERGR